MQKYIHDTCTKYHFTVGLFALYLKTAINHYYLPWYRIITIFTCKKVKHLFKIDNKKTTPLHFI